MPARRAFGLETTPGGHVAARSGSCRVGDVAFVQRIEKSIVSLMSNRPRHCPLWMLKPAIENCRPT